jgi:hypothetical protein
MKSAKAMLDELMGSTRNLTSEQKSKTRQASWKDGDQCAAYLTGMCVHDLFTNTRSDVGRCVDKHDSSVRAAYTREASDDPMYERRVETRALRMLVRIFARSTKLFVWCCFL